MNLASSPLGNVSNPIGPCWRAGSLTMNGGATGVAAKEFRRGSVVRRLSHEPLGWRPTTLRVTVRRYRCTNCGHVWRQDTSRAAEPRARVSRRAMAWALTAIVCQHLTIARVAEALAVPDRGSRR